MSEPQTMADGAFDATQPFDPVIRIRTARLSLNRMLQETGLVDHIVDGYFKETLANDAGIRVFSIMEELQELSQAAGPVNDRSTGLTQELSRLSHYYVSHGSFGLCFMYMMIWSSVLDRAVREEIIARLMDLIVQAADLQGLLGVKLFVKFLYMNLTFEEVILEGVFELFQTETWTAYFTERLINATGGIDLLLRLANAADAELAETPKAVRLLRSTIKWLLLVLFRYVDSTPHRHEHLREPLRAAATAAFAMEDNEQNGNDGENGEDAAGAESDNEDALDAINEAED
ncbi:hypothetical protein MPSEU_000930600 [Mayamaea pseudoterrestris]|nr:hypothetical protein MPSEU_000930600 [Mayamaea pseudoterrestris]